MIKVWGRKNSINVMKVLWCLDELGLDYERIDAGLQHGVLGEPFYGAKNPNRKIPTLEDGELVLWESNVIVRYLAARYGLGGLCPEDPGERALADQWMDWQQTALGPEITYIFWGQVRGSPDHQDPARVAAAASALEGLWGILDAHLATRDFVNGDTFTMGDIPVGATVWRWTQLDLERPALPHLEAWHRRLQERPGFREHVMQPLS